MKMSEDMTLEMSLVEGEEEESFLKSAVEGIKKSRQRTNQHKFPKGRKGNFNKHDRKRRHDDRNGEKPSKQAKTSSEEVTVAVAAE
jgi:hypothetical protein